MLELLNVDAVKSFMSDAASSDFTRTCAIFSAAAYIHASQVRKEIKSQITELVSVLKEDLSATRSMLASVVTRVDKIENVLLTITKGK